ncbi:MAG: C40 family peptidase [Salibacteraceae bacterium]
MKYWLAMLTLILYISVSGFSKNDKRLKKQFDKKQYIKCISIAKKRISKNPNDGAAHLYVSKSNTKLLPGINSKARQKQLVVSGIRSYRLAEKYNYRDRDFYFDELRPQVESYCMNQLNSKDSIKAYYVAKQLAKYMHDTLSFYKFHLIKQLKDHKPPAQLVVVSENYFEDSIRKALLSNAETLIGVPYSYGGESVKGFDCSGFTKYVYSSIGVKLPHNAHLQSEMGKHKTLDEAKPGDIVFFGYKRGTSYRAIHAGIIYDSQEPDSSVIHCVSGGVSLEGKNSSWDRYWKNKVLFISDILYEEIYTASE